MRRLVEGLSPGALPPDDEGPIHPKTPAAFATYASGGLWVCPPHLQILNQKLHQLALGHIKRLIVSMPPRHGKSEFCSRYFPAWYVGTFPQNRVILTSYEATFAETWGRRVRDLVREHGMRSFGIEVRGDVAAAKNWELTTGGGMATAGVGGSITGKGANLLIVDDPVKNAEDAISPTIRAKVWEWWRSTAYTRLEPGASALIIMTRWHPEDLAGMLLSGADETGDEWHELRLPALAEENDPLGRLYGQALWPDRFDEKALAKIRASLGDYWWNALYQQTPRNIEGVEWPDDYFDGVWFDAWPPQDRAELRLIALDPSKGKDSKHSDFCAITIGYLVDGLLYCDAVIERIPLRLIAERFAALAHQHNCQVGIVEANAFQELLADPIKTAVEAAGHQMRLVLANNMTNKVVRIRSLSEPLANRRIRFRRGSIGADLLVRQLRQFPLDEHDDGPDSLEMLWRLLRRETATGKNRDAVGQIYARVGVPGGW